MTSLHQRPALDLLAELRRGKTKDELTDEIHKLLAACSDTGKKGELTLKLVFEPDKDADEGSPRYRVADSITVKTPKRSTKPSLFYVTDSGNLTRRDPREDDYHGLVEVPDQTDADDLRDGKSRAAGDR